MFDIWIKYDADANLFFVKSDGSMDWGDPIQNGSLLSIWDIKKKGLQTTNGFEDFWINCLAIGDIENEPLQIIWSKNPNQTNIYMYYLYRKINDGSFVRIGEYNSQTFNYKDKSVKYYINYSYTASYYVTSYNGTESDATNVASLEVEFDWSNGLILSNKNNHPYLIWVPHPSFTTTHFYIYRAVATIPVDPKNLTYSLCAIRSASTYEFIDTEFEFGEIHTHQVYYYVKAYDSSSESFSPPTNIVNTSGEYNPQKIGSDKNNEVHLFEFNLKQNYPNPFNPVTQIKYSLSQDADVTLKVFDMLGREVDDLVNELKQEGSYEINFSSEGLSSGVYIYRITATNNGRILFTDSKQMILLR